MILVTPSQKMNPFKVAWTGGLLEYTVTVPDQDAENVEVFPPPRSYADLAWDLVPGPGDTDNALFHFLQGEGPEDKAYPSFIAPSEEGTYSIRVRVTHKPSGEYKEQVLTVVAEPNT